MRSGIEAWWRWAALSPDTSCACFSWASLRPRSSTACWSAESPRSFSMVSCFFWFSRSILLILTYCTQLRKPPATLAPVQLLISLAVASCFCTPALLSARSPSQYLIQPPMTMRSVVVESFWARRLTIFLPWASFSRIISRIFTQAPKYLLSSISSFPAVIMLAIFTFAAFSFTLFACLLQPWTQVVSRALVTPPASMFINLSLCWWSFRALFARVCHPETALMRII
mmetsp:Transcript_7995/g.17358  ORF Transcript_7995/g.17358 Transcript_7995/m.17358 type:complete len:227 (+) Transcript_7995:1250-1930(+)